MVEKLESPRKIMLMVRAGAVVDEFIKQLLPLLDKGDIIINLEKDRTERVDLSRENPKILKQLVDEWNKWANTHYVYPKGK